MRVLVSECERYFERPLCGQDHVHTQDCWHEEFQNALSDVRALQNRAERWKAQVDKLDKQISDYKKRPFDAVEMRGSTATFLWIDEASDWATAAKADNDAKAERAEKQLSELIRRGNYTQDSRVREIIRQDGIVAYQTPDGKQFTTADAAQRHATLFSKKA